MATYNVCIALDSYKSSEGVISVVSATDALDDGNLVVAKDLVSGNLDAYQATKPAAITDGDLAIVCAQEVYQDAMGNRLNINDKTAYNYPANEMLNAYRFIKSKRFALSNGLITGTPTVGSYLIPTAGAYGWTVAADLTGNSKVALYIEAISQTISVAGFNGITGVIARVEIA